MADRKISDLTALTTPASGDFLPIVDISEAAAASKNKRITIEELMRGVPDGTAAAPGIAFETDPNTGIYRPGADQLAVATNGTGRLFVDASGNVGVGVPSATNAVAAIGMAYGSQSGFGNGHLIFGTRSVITDTAPTERMRIDSSGRVGIGTTSPNEKLDVRGKLYLNNGSASYFDAASSGGLIITNPTAVRWEVNSSERAPHRLQRQALSWYVYCHWFLSICG
jgi:hypothetical protein